VPETVLPTVAFMVCSSARAVSVTVTVVETAPRFICMFSLSCVPTCTVASVTSSWAKPVFLNLIV
jgi:hypothetical protein